MVYFMVKTTDVQPASGFEFDMPALNVYQTLLRPQEIG